jgi:lipooligosaccharide transport system permease protein
VSTPLAVRVIQGHARTYRRTWRGTVITSFVNPVLFLLAMGVGLGELVDRSGGIEALGMPYLTYITTGLLAASAMQTAAADAGFPVQAGIRWTRTYHAALATPIDVRALVLGHLGWLLLRLAFTTIVYAIVIAVFDAAPLGGALLAVGPALLTGLAVAAPVTAFSAHLKRDGGLPAMFRFVIIPMFLFSGTFFSIDQLNVFLRPVAFATPLWHGVELCRLVAVGDRGPGPHISPLLNIAYLAVWVVVGTWLAIGEFRKRLAQ